MVAPPFDGYVETLGKVSSTCLVVYDRCRYSVPCELAGQIVSVRVYPEYLDTVAQDAVVASHSRTSNANKTRYDWQHTTSRSSNASQGLIATVHPLQTCRNRCCVWNLVAQARWGDRVMAKVLAAVPQIRTGGGAGNCGPRVLESGNRVPNTLKTFSNRTEVSGATQSRVETHLEVRRADCRCRSL